MSIRFSKKEIKFLIAMGLVLGMRELSMSMLSPFITIYGKTLKGNTMFLCGIAMGIYGLANALFQIPYGVLSDRYGRKPIILLGLLQLSMGLFLSFTTSNIYMFILSRALQGSGAVMAIAYSWIGDGIPYEKKGRAMSVAGTIVAIGAVAAFALGPILYKTISVKYMFLGCSIIVLFSLLFILFFIKEENKVEMSGSDVSYKSLLKDKKIIGLSICGFIFNYVMSEMFFIVPSFLDKTIGGENMWVVFVPAVLCGIIFMIVASNKSDKGYFKVVSIVAFCALLIGTTFIAIKIFFFNLIGTILIFSGFMILTSGIPSEVNKTVKKENRGGANGILQTLTFLGFFVGPTVTGFLVGRISEAFLQMIPMSLAVIGMLIIYKMKL